MKVIGYEKFYAEFFAWLRLENKTQVEAAKKLGVSKTHISAIANKTTKAGPRVLNYFGYETREIKEIHYCKKEKAVRRSPVSTGFGKKLQGTGRKKQRS